MKGRAEQQHDLNTLEAAAAARLETDIQAKFDQLRALYHGLKRTRVEYVAVESIDWEPIPGGQVLVLRMLYPYEMVRVELADTQVTELTNRAQGLTAGGAAVATPQQADAILGNGVLQLPDGH
jgi:hypothetical protein